MTRLGRASGLRFALCALAGSIVLLGSAPAARAESETETETAPAPVAELKAETPPAPDLSAPSLGSGITAYASKISFRLSSGILANEGRARGGTATLGGLNLAYSYYPAAQWAVGGGYRADFDFKKQTLPLSGTFLFSRWYFLGSGTRVSRGGERLRSQVLDQFALYIGPQFSHTGYYFGIDPTDEEKKAVLEGSFSGVEGIAGLDFRLSRTFELCLEGEMGLLSFAASDDRFRMKPFLFTIGISYLW